MEKYVYLFFFKQKTAYEMRISDWSSDVCSSDLPAFDDLRLARDAMPIDPGPRPDPSRHPAREAARAERRGGGRIADAHLAEHDEVEVGVDHRRAAVQRVEAFGFAHRGVGGEIGGRPVEVERDDHQLQPRRVRPIGRAHV